MLSQMAVIAVSALLLVSSESSASQSEKIFTAVHEESENSAFLLPKDRIGVQDSVFEEVATIQDVDMEPRESGSVVVDNKFRFREALESRTAPETQAQGSKTKEDEQDMPEEAGNAESAILAGGDHVAEVAPAENAPKGYSFTEILVSIKGIDLEKLELRKWKIGAMVEDLFEDHELDAKAYVGDMFAQERRFDGECARAADAVTTGGRRSSNSDEAAAFLQLREDRRIVSQRIRRRNPQPPPRPEEDAEVEAIVELADEKKSCPVGVDVRLLLKKGEINSAAAVLDATTHDLWFHRAVDYQVMTSEEAAAADAAGGCKCVCVAFSHQGHSH